MLLYLQTDAKLEQERLKCYISVFLFFPLFWGGGGTRVRVIRSVCDHVRIGGPC
jgi:hypothetical protein